MSSDSDMTREITQRATALAQEALSKYLGKPCEDDRKKAMRRYRRMLARQDSGRGRRKARRVDARYEEGRLIFRPRPFYVRTIHFSVGPGLVDEPKE